MPSPIIALQSISRVFDSGPQPIHALSGITLQIAGGEFVALSGPSGSGKSTLLNILGLADRPTSGSMLLSGKVVDFSAEATLTALRRNSIGYIFQYFNLLPAMSALENVTMMALLSGMQHEGAYEKSRAQLLAVGLGERLHHRPGQLSGGEMQRVAICRALIHAPALILADEPTGNLDSTNGAAVLDLIRSQISADRAVVMATHSAEAAGYATRSLLMHDGKIVS